VPVTTFVRLRPGTEHRARNILSNQAQLGPFPLERLKRVDKPTTLVTEAVQRIDMRNTAYGLAARGEYGSVVQKGVQKSLPGKYPLSAAQKDILDHIALSQSNLLAAEIAPIPQSPGILTRHIKATGYFLKADVVGTCRVPASAYYSHDKQGNPIERRYENAVVIVMRKEWNAVRESVMRSRLAQRVAIRAAYLLKLGRAHPNDQWWFDMEYIDGVIKSVE